MNLSAALRILVAAVVVAAAMNVVTSAADPYFVPYGAHRGRIHIGPRHARIRWGGGLTPYGAAVLMHGFDVAGSVGKVVLGASGDDSGSVGSESAAESNEAECQEQLRRTRELLEETKKVCCLKRGGEVAPEASAEPGAEPAAPPPDDYARIEKVKRDVSDTLPLILALQQETAERKKATEDFEKVLARDRQAFEAFMNAYQSP
ncbi:MAG TPA: hypothetical protein VMP01_17710 [Pirellulaceae bacterium]|nr:hypothetical protein [Pirellulaceae bacterium]